MLLIFGGAYFMTFEMHVMSSTYPRMITVAGLILSAANLGRAIYRRKNNIPIDMPGALSWEQLLSVIITLGAAFVYVITIRAVGYATSTFLFTTVFSYYMSAQARVYSKLWVYPAIGLGATLLLYAAFGLFLNVPLPRGILI